MYTFTSYKDKSSAKRGFSRAFKDFDFGDSNLDNFLAQVDGKWGFYKTDDGKPTDAKFGPQPTLADIAAAVGITEAQAEATVEASKEPSDTEPGIQQDPLAFAPSDSAPYSNELGPEDQPASKTHDYSGQEAPTDKPEDVMPAANPLPDEGRDPELDNAIERGIAGTDEDDNAPERPSALGAFAFAQLTAPSNSTTQTEPAQQSGSGLKIEKNRAESNGVKRPSKGTLCDQVWELAASLTNDKHVATLSEVVSACEAKGINKFTGRTQYARWRAFNGITGRAK